jgi:curved DNA-binding protein CbpA
MRDQPQPLGDPYRVLGLEPGASMAEVKRAYRRLAKAFHPDSAGEAALPRFLAIHEAYERLASGRSRAGIAPRPTARAPTPTSEPWRADPERARAARERARRGRSGGARPDSGSTGTRSRTGTTGATGASGRSTGSTGSPGAGTGSGAREGRRRGVRKATLGSTSYDEARDHTDATWSGASWYGPSSGEYWIVNPREYADPRKHGPGYQQRARRAAPVDATGGAGAVDVDQAAVDVEEEPVVAASAARGAAAGERAAPQPRGARTAEARATWPQDREAGRRRPPARRGWTAEDVAGAGRWAASGPGPGMRQAMPGDAGPRDPMGSITAAGRELIGGAADDPIRRLGLALVAWPPIGLAAAATIGDLTGCTTYSAECAGSDSLLPWLAQAAILGLLLLMPPLARLFVGGTIGVLLALVPVTAFLLVVGGGGAPQAAFALSILLAAAWLVGVAWAARGGAWATRATT